MFENNIDQQYYQDKEQIRINEFRNRYKYFISILHQK
jgi:hypothetical protein